MVSHEIHDTVRCILQQKSLKNVLTSLHVSYSRHKVAIADYRNVLKYLPRSQGPEETCLTLISPANKIYCAKFDAIKHFEILRFTYLFLPGILSSKEKLSTVQNDRRGSLVIENLQKSSQLVYVLLYRKQGRHYYIPLLKQTKSENTCVYSKSNEYITCCVSVYAALEIIHHFNGNADTKGVEEVDGNSSKADLL